MQSISKERVVMSSFPFYSSSPDSMNFIDFEILKQFKAEKALIESTIKSQDCQVRALKSTDVMSD